MRVREFFQWILIGSATLVMAGSRVCAEEPAPARVVLVGDSTVASGTGWGDSFLKLLRPGVEGINMARGGRSSKSYRDEGHWAKALQKKPTWVLIQFGHNDQPGKGPERETDAKTTFREKLIQYVRETQEAGASPVLVTSLTRRNFNQQGKIDPRHLEPMTDAQGQRSADLLNDYVEATRAVAAEVGVPLVDLNARSIAQLNELEPDVAIGYDKQTKDASVPDKTHLSSKGASATAKLVAEEVRKSVPLLAQLLEANDGR